MRSDRSRHLSFDSRSRYFANTDEILFRPLLLSSSIKFGKLATNLPRRIAQVSFDWRLTFIRLVWLEVCYLPCRKMLHANQLIVIHFKFLNRFTSILSCALLFTPLATWFINNKSIRIQILMQFLVDWQWLWGLQNDSQDSRYILSTFLVYFSKFRLSLSAREVEEVSSKIHASVETYINHIRWPLLILGLSPS